jgi:hypothetical protein
MPPIIPPKQFPDIPSQRYVWPLLWQEADLSAANKLTGVNNVSCH